MIAVALLDGPEAGATIFGGTVEPPDEIVVFRTEYVLAGTLVYGAANDPAPGDAIYRKVSRSDLFDKPGINLQHPNLGVGCAYEFVRSVEPS